MKKILYFSILLLLCYNSYAQLTWIQTNGPKSASVTCLHKGTNGVLYCGTNGAGIYYSTNNGDSWINLTSSPPYITAIAYLSPSYLFAGNNSYGSVYTGFYRSTDNGISWNSLPYYLITSLAIKQSNELLAASASQILRTTNYGNSFTTLFNPSGVNTIFQIYVDDANNIWACYDNGKLYFSSNAGSTWSLKYSTYMNYNMNAIIRNSTGNYFFSNDSISLQKSSNTGMNWIPVNPYNWGAPHAFGLNSRNELYCGNSNSIVFTTNEGISWKSINNPLFNNNNFTSLLISGNNSVFAGYNTGIHGLFRKMDNDTFFVENSNEFKNSQVTSLYKCPNNDIYCGARLGNIYKSTNNGIDWNVVRSGNGYSVTDITTNSSGTIFAAIYTGITKSSDNGLTWTDVPIYSGNVQKLAFNSNGIAFAGSTFSLLRSTNNGLSWSLIPDMSSEHILFCTNGYIFSSTLGGIYRSTDNGLTWVSENNGVSFPMSYMIKENSVHQLFAANVNSVYVSTNWGESWSPMSYLLPGSPEVILINSNNDVYISFGISNSGIYKWNYGNPYSQWTAINSGLFNKDVMNMIFDRNGYILAGTNGMGVFKSSIPSDIGNFSNKKIPLKFSLFQNYPNPFNPITKIMFDVASNVKNEMSDTRLIIYDILGREVTALVNEKLSAGTYEVEFDGSNYPSGVYFYKITAGDFSQSKKMILLK